MSKKQKQVEKFKNLPQKVLVNIFEYLCVADRLVAGLACLTWFEASKNPKFLNDMDVFMVSAEQRQAKYSTVTVKFGSSALKLFSKSTRNFPIFYFCEIDLDRDRFAKAFWAKTAKHITLLSLNTCKIKSKSLVNALKQMPQLTTLELDLMERKVTKDWCLKDFDELKGNNKITHFRWIDVKSFIKDDLFVALTNAFDRLESLLLAANPVDFNSIEFRMRSMNCCECILENCQAASHGELKFMTLVNFLKQRSNTVKRLHIDESKNGKFRYMAAIVAANLPLDLEEFDLKNSWSLQDAENLNRFLKTQKNLKRLVLKHVVFDRETIEIISTLVHLEKLNLMAQHGHDQFDLELKQLKSLQQLKELGFFELRKLSDKGFELATMSLNLSNLVDLAMHRIPLVKDKTFGKAVQQMTNLKKMCLIETENVSTDNLLQIVFQYCTRMEFLQITESKNITERGFNNTYRISRLTSLKTLMLTDLPNLTDKCLQDISSKVLRTLNLSKSKKITGEAVAAVIMRNPSLENLHMPTVKVTQIALICGLKVMKRRLNVDCDEQFPDC